MAPPKADSGKKKDMAPPDKTHYEEALRIIKAEIDALYKQTVEISAKIQEKSTGKEEFLKRKNEMRERLRHYQNIIDNHEKEKQAEYKKMSDAKVKEKEARGTLVDAKKKLGSLDSISKIDEEISRIEYKMVTESISLKEEKDCIKRIAELKAQKPEVKKFNNMEAQVSTSGGADEGSTKDTMARIAEFKDKISEARSAKRLQQDEYQKLVDTRNEVMKDVPGLWEEREAIQKKITTKQRERQEINAELQRLNREYSEWMAEKRAIAQEKNKADRLQRQADAELRKAQQVEEHEEEQPHLGDILLLEQTIFYCKSLMPQEKKEEAEVKEVKTNNPEGSVVLASKKDRNNDFYFEPKGGKKKKGNKRPDQQKDQPIKHTADSMQYWFKVGVEPPTSTADLPAIVEKLTGKLNELKEDVSKWESEKNERLAKKKKDHEQAMARAEAKRKEAEEAKEAALSRAREAEASRQQDADNVE